MCGASLLNNDVIDHRNTDVTATASVMVVLVLLLLTFQYLHEQRTSLGVCYIVLSVVIEYKVIPSNFDDISFKAGSLCESHEIPFVENVDKRW